MTDYEWPHNLGTSNGANTPFRALHDICGALLPVDGSPKLYRLAAIFGLHSSTYMSYLRNEIEPPLSCLDGFVRQWNDGDRPRVELSLTLRVEGGTQ